MPTPPAPKIPGPEEGRPVQSRHFRKQHPVDDHDTPVPRLFAPSAARVIAASEYRRLSTSIFPSTTRNRAHPRITSVCFCFSLARRFHHECCRLCRTTTLGENSSSRNFKQCDGWSCLPLPLVDADADVADGCWFSSGPTCHFASHSIVLASCRIFIHLDTDLWPVSFSSFPFFHNDCPRHGGAAAPAAIRRRFAPHLGVALFPFLDPIVFVLFLVQCGALLRRYGGGIECFVGEWAASLAEWADGDGDGEGRVFPLLCAWARRSV